MVVLGVVLLGQEGLLHRFRPAGQRHLLGAGRGVKRGDERQVLVGHRPIVDAEARPPRSAEAAFSESASS